MNLLGLLGYAGAGKDTAAAGLVARGWQALAFADGVRAALERLNPIVHCICGETRLSRLSRLLQTDERTPDWAHAKRFPEVRRLLQVLGTEVGREMLGEHVWVGRLAARVAALGPDARVVVTDVRFPNEAAWIRDQGGHLVRIVRPGVGPVNGHSSETALDGCPVAAELVNDRTPEDLQAALATLAECWETRVVHGKVGRASMWNDLPMTEGRTK